MANEIIYVGQEALDMRLDTNIDHTASTNLKIKYRKPDGTSGEWDAVLYNVTYLRKEFTKDANELDESGIWTFWTHATMADGRVIPGDPVQYHVMMEGSSI